MSSADDGPVGNGPAGSNPVKRGWTRARAKAAGVGMAPLLVAVAVVLGQHSGDGKGNREPIAVTAADRAQIRATAVDYFSSLQHGRYQHAYELLSSERHEALTGERQSPAKWTQLEAALEAPFLRLEPKDVDVRVDGSEPSPDGATRVLITGVGWKAPGSPCREREGLTWFRKEGNGPDAWRYEPGYNTIDARRKLWSDDDQSLFGVGCDADDQIEGVIEHYFGALKSRDFDKAWGLLTPAARRLFGSKRSWEKANAKNYSPYLAVGQVAILVYPETARTVRLSVSGIRWLGGGCKDFSGSTFVTRLKDGWRYDPGYGPLPADEQPIGKGCAP